MSMPRRIWIQIPAPRGPIPARIREELSARLERHAAKKWKGRVKKVLLRFRGAYAYVGAVEARPGEKKPPQVCRHIEKGEVPTELCRLGFLGGVDRWEYAFYKYSDEKYERSLCASGTFVATPEEAFDCSAVYLQ
jgi:hypothetical protein